MPSSAGNSKTARGNLINLAMISWGFYLLALYIIIAIFPSLSPWLWSEDYGFPIMLITALALSAITTFILLIMKWLGSANSQEERGYLKGRAIRFAFKFFTIFGYSSLILAVLNILGMIRVLNLISPSIFPPVAEGYGMALLVFSALTAIVIELVSSSSNNSFPRQYVPVNGGVAYGTGGGDPSYEAIQNAVPAQDMRAYYVKGVPKVLAVLDNMKRSIVLWLSLCSIALLIIAITYMVYPQGLTSQGFPDNSNEVLISLDAIALMFLFSLGPLGITYLVIDFIMKYTRN